MPVSSARRTDIYRLPYTERTEGEFRDLRSAELRLPRMRWCRVSVNGIHRSSKSRKATTRYANPGWAFGLDRLFVEYVQFHRLCWHLSFNVGKRGVTFSYGRRTF